MAKSAKTGTRATAKTAVKTAVKTAARSAAKTAAEPSAVDKPKSPAEWAYDRLVMYIRAFERDLDAKDEIAMGFAGDEAGVLRIEGLGYFDPDILTFYGRDEAGAKTQLIQHVTQLSVTLRAVPKADDNEEPPRRIGFHLTSGWLGGDSGDASA